MLESLKKDGSFNPSKMTYILVSMVAIVMILVYAKEYLITFIFALHSVGSPIPGILQLNDRFL